VNDPDVTLDSAAGHRVLVDKVFNIKAERREELFVPIHKIHESTRNRPEVDPAARAEARQ
jgi:hypothetical protein